MAFALKVLVYSLVCITIAAYMSLFERKLIARIQLRRGPNNCGFMGIFQPIADALKLLFKKVCFKDYSKLSIAAILLLFMASLSQLTLIPFSNDAFDSKFSLILVLLFQGVISLSEILIGISSKSKYGVIGAHRAYLQLLGGHIPFILLMIVIMVIFKSFSLSEIALSFQSLGLYSIPIAVIFFIAMLMIGSRNPFDFTEAESELVAGAYVEYGGILFALIYLSDYLNLLFISALTATIFLGGFNSSFLPSILALGLKTLFIVSLIILIRAILPRYRQDQMIRISWLILVPILLAYIFVLL